MNIGENIKYKRRELGITQKGLAQKMGVSQQMVAKWEDSENNLNIATITKIANALGIKVDDLICDTIQVDIDVEKIQLSKDEREQFNNIINLFKGVGSIPYLIDTSKDNIKADMIKLFSSLNKEGQIKAIEQMELLSQVPKYQASTTDVEGDPADNKK